MSYHESPGIVIGHVFEPDVEVFLGASHPKSKTHQKVTNNQKQRQQLFEKKATGQP